MDRNQAARIVGLLLQDIQDRRGFRQTWEGIDGEIQDEIIQRWLAIVGSDSGEQPRGFYRLEVGRATGGEGICATCAARFPADHAPSCDQTWPEEG